MYKESVIHYKESICNLLHTAGLPMSYKLGPCWDDVITWADFKPETIFKIPQPKLHGAMYILDFFVKPKNGLV